MARRRTKKRTHIGANNGNQPDKKSIDRSPKSMVIRIGAGEVGPSIGQLVKDMRLVMEPGTASKLRERKSNKLRDFTTMCGPLGVTHLLLFSRSPESGNTNLRMAITPRGPTLHFRVENYSLAKDLARSQRRPKNSKDLYATAPLLVMNNFTTSTQTPTSDTPAVPKHLETLVTTIFQSMFPPLNPQATPLSSIKRVLLLNREPPSDPSNNAYTISLRHYAITSRRSGLNKPIKRINQADKGDKNERRGRGVPNLGRMGDVSEFLLGGENGTGEGSYTSASETETDTDGEVEVMAARTKKLLGRKEREKMKSAAAAEANGASKSDAGRPGVEKRAIKLTELGPRMRLRLIKVEEGLCGGKIMWHDHIAKTKKEEKELEEKWEQKRKEKEERKRVQRENVERKKAAKQKGGRGSKAGGEEGEGSGDEDDEMDYDVEDDEYWQDDDDESGEEVDDDEDEDMEEG